MTTDPTFRLYSPDLYDCFLDLSVNDFSLKEHSTCLSKLIETNEISVISTNSYSIITISKYEDYQSEINYANQPSTNDQPATNQPSTSDQPATNQQLTTNKKNKKNKKNKNEKNNSTSTPDFEKINFSETYHPSCPNLPKILIQPWRSFANRALLASQSSNLQIFKFSNPQIMFLPTQNIRSNSRWRGFANRAFRASPLSAVVEETRNTLIYHSNFINFINFQLHENPVRSLPLQGAGG
jgi:hypothetical protein